MNKQTIQNLFEEGKMMRWLRVRMKTIIFSSLLVLLTLFRVGAQPPEPTRQPLVSVVDLNVGESRSVELCNGEKVDVKLLEIREQVDNVCNAVRAAYVKVELDGRRTTLVSGNYNLPIVVGKVRIDCPITKGYLENSRENAWGIRKDARLRLWPVGSPLLAPGTFVYPVEQRWFASDTQMANEPVFVDGGDVPGPRKIYYHSGLDFGGADRMVNVVSATDGLVVSCRENVLPGYENTPVRPRYDVVYVLDDRGWYYRYSHLDAIDTAVRLGRRVKKGQRIGILGKEGASGGWSHLHFEIKSLQPSGMWGTQEAYAFVWEAYLRQYSPKIIACARPHCLAWTDEQVELDASRSWSASGKIARYEWFFCDGTKATGPKVVRTYAKPGTYSEILKITDVEGRVDYDFAVVQILDKSQPKRLPPTIHAAYFPTFGIQPGDPVTFKVRTFRTARGGEVWDFGDGSPKVKVKSDGNADPHAKDGYATTVHRFQKPGDYIVTVTSQNQYGMKAVAHLHVRVGER